MTGILDLDIVLPLEVTLTVVIEEYTDAFTHFTLHHYVLCLIEFEVGRLGLAKAGAGHLLILKNKFTRYTDVALYSERCLSNTGFHQIQRDGTSSCSLGLGSGVAQYGSPLTIDISYSVPHQTLTKIPFHRCGERSLHIEIIGGLIKTYPPAVG